MLPLVGLNKNPWHVLQALLNSGSVLLISGRTQANQVCATEEINYKGLGFFLVMGEKRLIGQNFLMPHKDLLLKFNTVKESKESTKSKSTTRLLRNPTVESFVKHM